MNEETVNLMPRQKTKVWLKPGDEFKILAVSDHHVKCVERVEKTTAIGEKLVLFTNRNDSPVFIKINRSK